PSLTTGSRRSPGNSPDSSGESLTSAVVRALGLSGDELDDTVASGLSSAGEGDDASSLSSTTSQLIHVLVQKRMEKEAKTGRRYRGS
ncbi:unnamed protein product, partial [Amoebophrya sp. A25]